MRKQLGVLVVMGLAMSLWACGPDGSGLMGGDDDDDVVSPTPTPTGTAAPVSFRNDVVPIFQGTCGNGVTGCHDAAPYNAAVNAECRGWLSLADEPLGSVVNSGPNAGQPTGCPDFDLYERLVDIGAWTCGPTPQNPERSIKYFIVPGDLANSYLYQRVTGQATPCFVPGDTEFPYMPPVGTIPQSQIDILRAWIEQGAPNN